MLHILNTLMSRPALPRAPATDLSALLRSAAEVVRRRSLVFVISDFISAPGWDGALAMLARRHEVVAVRLLDPLETRLPQLGLIALQDSETGEQLFVDTQDRAFRRRFARAAEQREAELREVFQRAGVDALELSTEDEVGDAILSFAEMRRSRARGRMAV